MDWKVNNGYVLIFAAGMLWGTIGLFVKQMEESGSTPAMTSFLRVLFAALAMLPLCIVWDGWRSLLVNGKTLLYCALLGVVCHGVYNIFYSLSVTITGVSVSAVLLNIAPIFTLLFFGSAFFGTYHKTENDSYHPKHHRVYPYCHERVL